MWISFPHIFECFITSKECNIFTTSAEMFFFVGRIPWSRTDMFAYSWPTNGWRFVHFLSISAYPYLLLSASTHHYTLSALSLLNFQLLQWSFKHIWKIQSIDLYLKFAFASSEMVLQHATLFHLRWPLSWQHPPLFPSSPSSFGQINSWFYSGLNQ